jgi:hypothetical protein
LEVTQFFRITSRPEWQGGSPLQGRGEYFSAVLNFLSEMAVVNKKEDADDCQKPQNPVDLFSRNGSDWLRIDEAANTRRKGVG